MMSEHDIIYNEGKGVLSLYKITDNEIVRETEGNYGVILYRDVKNNIIKIDIPEPNVLLGMDIEDLKRF